MFHIHIDATSMPVDFDKYVSNQLGFARTDFAGHPEGFEHYEPANHLTYKTTNVKEYRQMFRDVVSFAESGDGMSGYIEGEYVALDMNIEPKPYDSSGPLPFRLHTRFLPIGTFRETEIHITLNKGLSDKRLLTSLLEMGFFCAYLPKKYGTAAIFTAQGSRSTIDQILPSITDYLQLVGGAVECSIKEERITHWWLSRSDIPRPPVVDTIEWLEERNQTANIS